MLSYLPDAEAQPVFLDLGFDAVRYIERDGAQAYELMNDVDVVVVCRGTEPNEWNDIKADANALTDLAETVGRVHRGFKREVDDIWPELEETLDDERRNVWFTGHSLGGAMATICAGRCKLSDIAAVPVETVTFGSPRVGTMRYVQNAGITHLRWVNNNDIVTRVPPTWLATATPEPGCTSTATATSAGSRHVSGPRTAGPDSWTASRTAASTTSRDECPVAAYVAHIRRAADSAVVAVAVEGLLTRQHSVPGLEGVTAVIVDGDHPGRPIDEPPRQDLRGMLRTTLVPGHVPPPHRAIPQFLEIAPPLVGQRMGRPCVCELVDEQRLDRGAGSDVQIPITLPSAVTS